MSKKPYLAGAVQSVPTVDSPEFSGMNRNTVPVMLSSPRYAGIFFGFLLTMEIF